MITIHNPSRFLLLPTRQRKKVKIPFDDILYLEGSDNYTLIHLNTGKVKVSSKTLLYHIQNSLNDSFIRIHRAFCVNKKYVKESQRYDFKHITHLYLNNGKQLSVARRRRHVLAEL
jgi:DNA-binding LytR/AlgR family response regulator